MSNGPTYKVKFRRRREGRTNYQKRLGLLKSGKPRLVVRKSNNSTIAEVVLYRREGDETKAFFSSVKLKKMGWKGHTGNLPASYLAGYMCGKKALKAGVKEAVLDIGLETPMHGGRIFAALKGAIDAGMSIAADEGVFPKEGRLTGKAIGGETEKSFGETKKNIDKEFGE